MEPIIEDSVETNVQPTDKAPATSMLPALTDEEMKAVTIDQSELMKFDTLNNEEVDMTAVKPQAAVKVEYRRVPVPAHRYSPLRTNWETILKTPVTYGPEGTGATLANAVRPNMVETTPVHTIVCLGFTRLKIIFIFQNKGVARFKIDRFGLLGFEVL